MAEPARALLRWVANAVSPGSRVLGGRGLRGGGAPGLGTLSTAGQALGVVVRTGDAASPADRERCAIEAAALTIAEHHRLPAPRLLAADPDGNSAGELAIAMSVLPGSSRIPVTTT